MKYNSISLTKPNESILETEILFTVASARAEGNGFVRLDLPNDDNEKINACSVKILKTAKRQGKIQFYIFGEDIRGESTEAEYLRNKYPAVADMSAENPFILVKI